MPNKCPEKILCIYIYILLIILYIYIMIYPCRMESTSSTSVHVVVPLKRKTHAIHGWITISPYENGHFMGTQLINFVPRGSPSSSSTIPSGGSLPFACASWEAGRIYQWKYPGFFENGWKWHILVVFHSYVGLPVKVRFFHGFSKK